MRMLRSLGPHLPGARAALLVACRGPAQAQTKITVGKIVGGVGFHIPSYVAMDQGFFKDEGLDARFVALTGRPHGHRRRCPATSTSCRSPPAARRRR